MAFALLKMKEFCLSDLYTLAMAGLVICGTCQIAAANEGEALHEVLSIKLIPRGITENLQSQGNGPTIAHLGNEDEPASID